MFTKNQIYYKIYYKIKYRKMIKTNLQPGTKLIVVSDSTNSGIPLGTKVALSQYYQPSSLGVYVSYLGAYVSYTSHSVTNNNYYLNLSDVRLYDTNIEDIKEELEIAEKELNEAKNNIENIKLKIEYLTETGNKNFDENEYRAYTTIKALENSNLSTLEKAKQIASLFNN
jgi:hypothetical protein